MILVGRMGGAYGVRGWSRVYSYTDPPANLLQYSPWQLSPAFGPGEGRHTEARVAEGRTHGKGLIVRLQDCDSRERAERLTGLHIRIADSQLPELAAEDYYWKDLIGLKVFNQAGQLLGEVAELMETGANDVLVVRPTAASEDDRQRLVPWLPGRVIGAVDLAAARLTVAWELDY